MKMRIAVFFGGRSVEHDISILSAIQALKAFDPQHYEVIPVYISADNHFYIGSHLSQLSAYQNVEKTLQTATMVNLNHDQQGPILKPEKFWKKQVRFDVAFPIVHGQGMEDGILAALFELHQIPYVESEVLSSGIAQDKVVMKKIFAHHQLPIIPYFWLYRYEMQKHAQLIEKKAEKLGYPLILKPARLGSSIGIQFVNSWLEFTNALEVIGNYDFKIIVEKALTEFREFNCAVLGDVQTAESSVIEEVKGHSGILTFQEKYEQQGGEGMAGQARVCPAQIDESLEQQISTLAIQTFQVTESSGVARIDFLFDVPQQTLYVNEINAIPGSLSYYLWEKKGVLYPELIHRLIQLALVKYQQKRNTITTYQSSQREAMFNSKTRLLK